MLKIVSYICILAAFTSCKTIQNLASKDTSAPKKAAPKTRQTGEVVFLDNITVTPGSTVTTKQTTKGSTAPVVNTLYIEPKKETITPTIESADALQLKYAIVFDATVENLTNTNMLRSIDQWWGTRYCLGGSTKSCIDCSAFTRAVTKDVFEVELPRTAQEQYKATERVEIEDLQEGDLVFFYTSGRRISHVGIYIMNNKFVHAAASQGVSVSDLTDSYWKARYRGAGRITRRNEDMSGTK